MGRRWGVAALVAVAWLVAPWSDGRAWAANWTVHAAAGSHGQAQSQVLTQPAPSAACQSSGTKVIVVSWTSASHTTYTVYQSTTTVGGTYSQVATGLTAGSWTSASLGNGNYWYKVSGAMGTNWLTGQSAATGETTIQSVGSKCVQP